MPRTDPLRQELVENQQRIAQAVRVIRSVLEGAEGGARTAPGPLTGGQLVDPSAGSAAVRVLGPTLLPTWACASVP